MINERTDIAKIVFIDDSVEIAEDVKIYPNVYILGNSKIGKGTIIYPNTTIEDSVIGENCVIKSSYIEESEVKNNVKIGPFAGWSRLRHRTFSPDLCIRTHRGSWPALLW